MRHWFKDRHLRSLLKNSGYLASSKLVAAIAGFATLAMSGRALGVSEFGLLILIASYAQAAAGLGKFNSWQVVVRYGNPALERGDTDMFKRAAGFAIGLDLTSGLAAMVAAMLLLPYLGDWLGIPRQFLGYSILYCTLLPLTGSAVSGVLRALDRFDLMSWQDIIHPIVRAAMTLVAWLAGWTFPAFLAIWFVAEMIGTLSLWAIAWRELRRRRLLHGIRPSLSARGLPNGWQFAVSVNLNASLNITWGPMSRLLISGALSPAAAGLYRVASMISDAAQRPTIFLNKAFYPQVMRLDPSTKKPWKLMLRVTALSTIFGVTLIALAALCGKWILATAFGPTFVPAYGAMLVLLGVPLVAMISFPLPAMLDSLGRTNVPTAANFAGALLYVAMLFPLVDRLGLVGAGLAFLAGRILVSIVMAAALSREHRRLRTRRLAEALAATAPDIPK